MEIIIDDSYTLADIQKEFKKHFPNLKLEFFELGPSDEKITTENMISERNKTLGEIRHIHVPGYISINGHQKVSTLELNFKQSFGINIMVYRKSGDTWLQTTTDNDLTLTEENKKGEETIKTEQIKITNEFDQYNELIN